MAVLLVKTNHHLKQETETQEELKEPICNNKYLQRHQTLLQTTLNKQLVFKKKAVLPGCRDRQQV